VRRHGSAGIALAVLAVCPGPAHAAEYVNDPLTAPTFAGRGSRGGSFDAGGWTTTNDPNDPVQDSIWYEIPDALPTGSIEYTVTGLGLLTSLLGADHDILTLYQAPGEAEPIEYSPYFRNNDFKVMTRIFGAKETGRPGAMKLEMAFCPRGEPWHHDTACTAGCDQSGIAYAGGSPVDVGWDPAVSYRMRVEWAPGTMSFSRDGQTLGALNFTGTYAPQPMRVRIGSPRHGIYPGEAYMPQGITIKDVLIEGTPGGMTPICGTTVPDAGTGGSAGAGGSLQDAGGTEEEHGALQDVTAAVWESAVFPDVNDLNVEGDASGQPAGVVYLRFPPVGGTVQQALLRLRAAASSSASGGSGTVCSVADDTWQETTLTWASRPAVSTSCAGSVVAVDPDAEIEWDVTPLVAPGGNVNLAIVSADPDGAHYLSKEADSANGPRLFVVTQAAAPDAGGGSAGGGASGGSGTAASGGSAGAPAAGGSGTAASGGSGTAASGGLAADDRGSTSGDDPGCGCRAAGARAAQGSSLATALVVLLSTCRRARRRPGRRRRPC
jgi:hypothetical protein